MINSHVVCQVDNLGTPFWLDGMFFYFFKFFGRMCKSYNVVAFLRLRALTHVFLWIASLPHTRLTDLNYADGIIMRS